MGDVKIGSLFSGIGGLELGLEWAGVGHTVWHCESDPYASKVLAKHWPGVPNLGDITKVDWSTVEPVEVICGGFPCQDISLAGRGGGLAGERSGLWREYIRAVRHLRPRFVVVENVSALLARGLGDVLADLAASGYDTEWDCIPAAAVGAPHRRDRVFCIAVSNSDERRLRRGGADTGDGREVPQEGKRRVVCGGGRSEGSVADSGGARRRQDTRSASGDETSDEGRTPEDDHVAVGDGEGRRPGDVADSDGTRLEGHGGSVGRTGELASTSGGATHRTGELADTDEIGRRRGPGVERPRGRRQSTDSSWWAVEPDVGRVAHGVSRRVDRLRALGNAVVPQVAEVIGQRILELNRQPPPRT